VGRSPIEPLRIVHDADQRLLPGHIRQQAQDRQADREAIRSVTIPEAERGAQGGALRIWKALDPV
jgi:hypothetical protein